LPMTKPESLRRPALLPWLVLLACSATAALAENRTFFNPKLGGSPVAFCSRGACGKPAADNFCRNAGYDTALTFARRQAVSNSSEEPTGFTQIKCYKPSVEGSGKPAAVTNTAGKSGRLVGADLR
jgi:hypothetical protein